MQPRSPDAAQTEQPETEPNSVLWSELFFDLVAVAAMVVLATALEHHATWVGIAVFSVTFAAIWMCWSSIALYVNAADDLVERSVLVACMAAIAVMAASLLDLEAHANTFAIAFLACRAFTQAATIRSGRVFPGLATLLAGANLPWLISLFVPTGWKFALWGLGLAIDLLALLHSADRRAPLERAKQRAQRRSGKGSRRRRALADKVAGHARGRVAPVRLRPHHLAERLGTFVIIVLGESVLQLVRAASETEWSAAMWVTAAAAFAIIVAVWRQTFAYGFSAAPQALAVEERVPAALTLHLISTGSLVVMAAGLGELVRLTAEHEESLQPWSWIAAGGLAAYLLTSIAAALLAGKNRTWILRHSLPAALVVITLGVAGPGLPAWAFALGLALAIGWLGTDTWFSRRAGSSTSPSADPA